MTDHHYFVAVDVRHLFYLAVARQHVIRNGTENVIEWK